MSQKQMTINRCPACGEFLPAGRVDKRFHNGACRSRYWRRMHNLQANSALAQKIILDIVAALDDTQFKFSAAQELNDIVATLCSTHEGAVRARLWTKLPSNV